MTKEDFATNSKIEYRDILGHPGYRVGSDGTVWSSWKKKPLKNRKGTTSYISPEWKQRKPYCQIRGHLRVHLKGKPFSVHRLVLEAFAGPCPETMECCHFDGNPANNQLSNLRWATRKDNHADMIRHGNSLTGEKNTNAKLTDEKIILIRNEFATGSVTKKNLADKYGVSCSTMGSIIRREIWKHI